MNRLGWILAIVFVLVGLALVSMIRFETTPSANETSPQVRQETAAAGARARELLLPSEHSPVPQGSAQSVEQGAAAAAGAGMALASATARPAVPFAVPAMQVPVQGVARSELHSSWGDPRDGGERTHTGLDILAPRGTPVVAALPGRIEKLYTSQNGGGITLYLRSEDQRLVLYYAHLGGYAPGITEGKQVAAGDVLGFVGDTGNAASGNHHLHFGVTVMAPGERWHEGLAVDPYPLLASTASGG